MNTFVTTIAGAALVLSFVTAFLLFAAGVTVTYRSKGKIRRTIFTMCVPGLIGMGLVVFALVSLV